MKMEFVNKKYLSSSEKLLREIEENAHKAKDIANLKWGAH